MIDSEISANSQHSLTVFTHLIDDMMPTTHATVTAVVDLASSDTDSVHVDYKSRFGKPVMEPNLAENIKGKSLLLLGLQ